VKPRQPRPAHDEQSSQNHEEDECQMNYEYEVGESPIDQAAGAGNVSLSESAGPAGAS